MLPLSEIVKPLPLKRIGYVGVRLINSFFNPLLITPLPGIETIPTSSTVSERDGIPSELSSAVVRECSLEIMRKLKTGFLHRARYEILARNEGR